MMTYQMMMKVTGADKKLVLEVKHDIIGNRHNCTTEELHKMIHEIQRRIKDDSITKSKSTL